MMSILMWPLAVWGVVTAVLVILLIYRSTLTMQEDDQLFLGESESHMEKEQIEIMAKVNKITPRSEEPRLNSSHRIASRMPSSA